MLGRTCSRILGTIALALPSSAETVTISQIDWLSGAGGFLAENSEWGLASIQLGPGDESQFVPDGSGYYGYLQVVTNPNGGAGINNWAVQNKAFVFESIADFDGRLADSMSFDLGVPRGTDLSGSASFRAAFLVTPVALGTMPVIDLSQLQYQVSVIPVEWIYGGGAGCDYDGEAGRVAPPPASNYLGMAPEDPKPLTIKIKVKQDEIEKVKEELQGCGPGAAGRGIKYLKPAHAQTAQQVYDALKAATHMNTSLGADGTGTSPDNYLRGKSKYNTDNDLGFTAAKNHTPGITLSEWNDDGAALKRAIEIHVLYGKNPPDSPQDANKNLGGHIAFLVEVTYVEDTSGTVTKLEANLLDDKKQGDDTADNSTEWRSFKRNANGDYPMEYGKAVGSALQYFYVQKLVATEVGPPDRQPLRSMEVRPIPGSVRDAGVFHFATGTWTRGDQHQDLGDKTLYANTAGTGFFGVMDVGCDLHWTDEGRIPGTGAPENAKADRYLIQGIQIAYCSSVLGAAQQGGLEFFEPYASCTAPTGPSASFSFTVPGGVTSTACWIVTFDLKGTTFGFELSGDGDGVFDGTTGLDNFGWTLHLLDQGTGGRNGPLLNGDPNNSSYGDGTYYQESCALYATGLGTVDQYWLADPQGCYANGCYWFGGYMSGNPFSSFWLVLTGDNLSGLGWSKYCATTANSTGAAADISAAGTSAAAGDITLSSSPLPNQPGLFFHGPSQAGVPFGNGVRCVGGSLVRGSILVAAGNVATYTYDNSDNKHSLLAFAGLVRYFQHWFRDPMAGGAAFNLSNGVSGTVPP